MVNFLKKLLKINIIHYTNKLKENHVFSQQIQKEIFDKIQCPFTILKKNQQIKDRREPVQPTKIHTARKMFKAERLEQLLCPITFLKNEAKVSALTTPIQHHTESPRWHKVKKI